MHSGLLPSNGSIVSGRGRHLYPVPVAISRPKTPRLKVLSAASVDMSMPARNDLPGCLKQIVATFESKPVMLDKFKELLSFGSKMDPLPVEYRTDANRVHGCVARVWLMATLDDGVMHFKADSDAGLTKGLAALLVEGLNGCSPEEILRIEPDFIEKMGCRQSLTRSRNNGFLNMFEMMQQRTLELASIAAASTTEQDGSSNIQRATEEDDIQETSPANDSTETIRGLFFGDLLPLQLTDHRSHSMLVTISDEG